MLQIQGTNKMSCMRSWQSMCSDLGKSGSVTVDLKPQQGRIAVFSWRHSVLIYNVDSTSVPALQRAGQPALHVLCKLANVRKALDDALRALRHGADLEVEAMLAAQVSHPLLNFPQIVTGKPWKQMMLHLKVETAWNTPHRASAR